MTDLYKNVHPTFSDIDQELAMVQLAGLSEQIEEFDNEILEGNLNARQVTQLKRMNEHSILYCRNTRKALAERGVTHIAFIVNTTGFRIRHSIYC